MSIDVIDNCIPQFYQDMFESLALGRTGGNEIENSLPWRIKYEQTAKNNGVCPISFKHILKSDAELSNHLADFAKIPQIVTANLNYTLADLMYARVFLTLPYKTELKYHSPHTDLNYPHTSLIYYVNDSDGDTVFFEPDMKTIFRKVSPKKGRCVLFNGLIPHGAGIPSEGARCIVNYNIQIGKKNEF